MLRTLLALACSGLALSSPAVAADNLYVIAHVDIVAPGGNLDPLRNFVAESQKDPGAIRLELLQQGSRHNHFTIVEVWQDMKAFEGHSAAEHTKQFREKVQPMLGSPFDERLNTLLP